MVLPETLDDRANCTAQPLCFHVTIDVPGSDVLRVVQREPRYVVQVCNNNKTNVVFAISLQKIFYQVPVRICENSCMSSVETSRYWILILSQDTTIKGTKSNIPYFLKTSLMTV
jgi:hypothetical protein